MKIPNGEARLIEGYVSEIRAHEAGYNPKTLIGILVTISVKVPYERQNTITGDTEQGMATYSVPIHYPLGAQIPEIGTNMVMTSLPVVVLTTEEETDDNDEDE